MEVRYPPPLKRGISAILARYPMKTRQMGAIPPSAILSRKGIARYGGVSRTGPLSLFGTFFDTPGRKARDYFLETFSRVSARRASKLPWMAGRDREVLLLHGVGADGVGVKFPIFAVNCCCLPLSFRRSREKRRKRGKMRKNRGKMRKKKGKITPTPSTPTPLRTSQRDATLDSLKVAKEIRLQIPSF